MRSPASATRRNTRSRPSECEGQQGLRFARVASRNVNPVVGTAIAASLGNNHQGADPMSADKPDTEPTAVQPAPPARPPSKKEQILALFLSGLGDIGDIALITRSRPSYVASVLQEAGLHQGYFDLYTSTAQPMNVYSK